MMADAPFTVYDARFRQLVPADARLDRLTNDLKYGEGTVWVPEGGCLLFSDIHDDSLKCWSAGAGVHIWRRPSHHVNGNTLDREGRLISGEGSTRRLTRTERDGSITVLADRYAGKRLNAPNDVVVKSDGTIWFTDNPSAIIEEIEQPHNNVFRLDPGAKEPIPVIDDCRMPNGICFSPDESRLYVGDDSGDAHHLRAFTVQPDNSVRERGIFAVIDPGPTDGIRVDIGGNLFASAGDGIHIFTPQGVQLGCIHAPEAVTNCAFGGAEGSTLFIITRPALYAITLTTKGVQWR